MSNKFYTTLNVCPSSITLGGSDYLRHTIRDMLECCGTEEQKEKMFYLLMRERVSAWAINYSKFRGSSIEFAAVERRVNGSCVSLPGTWESVSVHDLIKAARERMLVERGKFLDHMKFDFYITWLHIADILCGLTATYALVDMLQSVCPIVDDEDDEDDECFDYPCSEAAFFRASY